MLQRLNARLRALWYWNRRESELDQEIRFHLSEETDERVAAGLPADEAGRAAQRDFGNVTRIREQTRDVWVWPWLQDVGQDVRFAARLLIRDRWFTLAAAGVLALGIGANGAGFTLVYGALRAELPFHEPGRIMLLWTEDDRARRSRSSEPDYEDWRTEARSFSDLAAMLDSTINLSDKVGAAQRVRGAYVTANLFRLLGEAPAVGRDFRVSDDQPGAAAVTIIGHRVWQNRYNSDPAVLGRTHTVNGTVATIVGVMPPRMRFPDGVDIWVPRAQLPREVLTGQRDTRNLRVFGRLADGVSVEQARVELASIGRQLGQQYPATNEHVVPALAPYGEIDRVEDIEVFLLFQGAVAFVLLIACANVANLLIARAGRRSGEMSVRAALGASRWRIVRQLLIESILLASVGGIGGVGLAVAGVRWFDAATQGAGLPYWITFPMDWVVIAFIAAICLATSALFGLAPALHVARTYVSEGMKEAGRSHTGGLRARRWAHVLIAAELALTLIVLSGAGFMVQSFLATVERSDPGVDASLLTMEFYLPPTTYPEVEARAAFFRQFEDRLHGIAAIEASAITTHVPLEGRIRRRLTMDGRGAQTGDGIALVGTLMVGDDYFETLDVQLLRGRPFTRIDGQPGQEAAIVNRRFTEMYFADDDPVGRRIRLDLHDQSSGAVATPWVTIVGVAPNIPQQAVRALGQRLPLAYLPHRTESPSSGILLVRSRGNSREITTLVQDNLRAIDPNLPLFNIQSLEQRIADQRIGYKVIGATFSTFALIALLLSAVGLYAVTANSVTQRTPEIGLRVALGAQPHQVMWLVLRLAVRPLIIGIPLGLAGAFGVGQLLQSMLFQTSPTDATTLISIVVVLMSVVAMACLIPARRAARLDPAVALRWE